MNTKECKKYCKWLGYQYKTDDLKYILGQEGFKCEKHKVFLGSNPIRCKECLEEKCINREDVKHD